MAETRTSKKNWQKVKDLLEHHKETFSAMGVENPAYIPKMFYTPAGKDEMHVSFFLSEFKIGKDIYTEMVNRDYESEDPKRELYKWDFNPQWEIAYEKTDTAPVRYLVPVSELKKVFYTDPGKVVEKFTKLLEEDCVEGDCEMEEMSMRDLLAIIQGVPISGKKWLNEAIIECNRRKNIL